MNRFLLAAVLSILLVVCFSPRSIADSTLPQLSAADISCLRDVGYWEARGEGLEGMRAVDHVVLNSAHRYNRSICEESHSGRYDGLNAAGLPPEKRTAAALRVYRNRGQARHPSDLAAWRLAAIAAGWTLLSPDEDPTRGATFFHAQNCFPHGPEWKRVVFAAWVGHHLFFREV